MFVTDDESDLSAQAFLDLYRARYPNSPLTVFGFVAQDLTTSPCGYGAGNAYVELAQATGGKTYNICDETWDAHFDDLAIEVSRLAQMIFLLEQSDVNEVEKVFVDGKEVPQGDYLVVRNKVRIHSKYFSETKEYKVSVKYKYNKKVK